MQRSLSQRSFVRNFGSAVEEEDKRYRRPQVPEPKSPLEEDHDLLWLDGVAPEPVLDLENPRIASPHSALLQLIMGTPENRHAHLVIPPAFELFEVTSICIRKYASPHHGLLTHAQAFRVSLSCTKAQNTALQTWISTKIQPHPAGIALNIM